MGKDSQEPGKLNPGLLYLLIFLPSMVAYPGGLEGAPELLPLHVLCRKVPLEANWAEC